MDEFEQYLKRQPVRALPPEWRDEILSAARVPHEEPAVRPAMESKPWWLAWLWPSPTAWAGVACAWGLIFCLDAASRPESSGAVLTPTPATPGISPFLAANSRWFQHYLFITGENAPRPPKARKQESPGASIRHEPTTHLT